MKDGIAELLIAILLAISVCGSASATEADPSPAPRSYLNLPTVSVPYVWERQAHGKHIAVIGTRHTRDPASPMFDQIEKVFDRVRPQVMLHESTAPPGLSALPRDQAIQQGADIGFAVHLAGRHGATVLSGDASEKAEFAALLAHSPAEVVSVFLTGQRLIGGRNPDLVAISKQYPGFFADYLAANGLPRGKGWDTWEGFLQAYENVVGQPLSRESWNPDLVSAVQNTGRLSDLSRAGNAARDEHLLAAIRSAVKDHDRVVVVFGYWHVLALEPMLEDALGHGR